jgi:hypothetical protein
MRIGYRSLITSDGYLLLKYEFVLKNPDPANGL